MTTFGPSLLLRALFTAGLTVTPGFAQDDTPLTRLFDTGAASAQPLADSAVAQRAGWTLVPEDTTNHAFSGDAVLLNDKLAVVLRKQGAADVYARAASGFRRRCTTGPTRDGGAALDAFDRFTIVDNSSAAVRVEAACRSTGPAAVQFRLTTGEGILEIRSGPGTKSLAVQSPARHVVVPDYFGDDMVFGAEAYRGVHLPAENFCLHLLEGGESILMAVWPSHQQHARLAAAAPGAEPGSPSTVVSSVPGKSLWLAFLESPGLWRAGPEPGDWRPPFPAKWRFGWATENGMADSWTSESGAPAGPAAGHAPAPAGPPEPRRPRPANASLWLVYPIDRSAATPLTVTCPTDVMRNTLGVGPCQYILACEGMAAQGDPTPNAVMQWVEKQFEAGKERKAADEIQERLNVMTEHVHQARSRIQRYADFSRRLQKLLASPAGGDPFRVIAEDLDHATAAGLVPAASPERARQWAADVGALVTRPAAGTAGPANGPNALATCRQLGDQLRALGAVQDRTLAQCRMAARRLKAQARTSAAAATPEKAVALEVQRLADELLEKK